MPEVKILPQRLSGSQCIVRSKIIPGTGGSFFRDRFTHLKVACMYVFSTLASCWKNEATIIHIAPLFLPFFPLPLPPPSNTSTRNMQLTPLLQSTSVQLRLLAHPRVLDRMDPTLGVSKNTPHLLNLPQELQDTIFDYAYPPQPNNKFWC